MGNLKIKKINNPLIGKIVIPPDKSISHRALIFGAMVKDEIAINNISLGEDCLATLKILEEIGIKVKFLDKRNIILNSKDKCIEPKNELYCGNSGTSARLLAGFLAGADFNSVLIGDESLSKRPMKRIIEPLSLMGAKIKSKDNKLPLKIEGSALKGISYFSPIPSAQVKSAILLAGLNATDKTTVYEKYLSRNHSELMLKYLEADIQTGVSEEGYWTKISKSNLKSKKIDIPGDISSAAFFMVAGAIVENSEILIENVGINPTRTGILDIFEQAGINFEILNKRKLGLEDVADIKVKYTPHIKPFKVSGEIIPRLIDEIPILAILATKANGVCEFLDASDLRNKESDRIKSIVEGLSSVGIDIEEKPEGFIIKGSKCTSGALLKTHLDHRLAMSYYIISLTNENETEIEDFNCVNTSFPEFLEKFKELSEGI